jgi:hypothetical protein
VGGSKRKRLPGSIARRVKYELAIRDGTLETRRSGTGEAFFARCAECNVALPLLKLTLGHILPLSDGGTNAQENLRLECLFCNNEADEKRYRERTGIAARSGRPTGGKPRRPELRDRDGDHWRDRRLYDSIEVLDVHGIPISFTSKRRIKALLKVGAIKVISTDEKGDPTAVQLGREKVIENPDRTPLSNRCVACGTERYLNFYRFWPEWHPKTKALRKTRRTAALCRACLNAIDNRMRAALRKRAGEIPAASAEEESFRRSSALLLHVHERLVSGLDLHPVLAAKAALIFGQNPLERLREVGLKAVAKELGRELLTLSLKHRRMAEERQAAWRNRVIQSGFEFDVQFWEIVRKHQSALSRKAEQSKDRSNPANEP